MITRIKEYILLNENINISGLIPVILFTDVVGSSKLWSDNPTLMEKYLDQHFQLITELIQKYDGFIVKTIGDAFMIYFNKSDEALLNAIKFAKDVIINEKQLSLRIGIAAGNMYEKKYTIQHCELVDFFGNTINTASRLESKVAEPNELAFTFLDSISTTQSEKIKDYIQDFQFDKILYSNSCSNDSELIGKRSGRLLTDIQINKCKNLQDLKGIKDLVTYKIKIK